MGAFETLTELMSKTIKAGDQGVDFTAHSTASFAKEGEKVTDPLALAAHTARGRDSFRAAPGNHMHMSPEDFVSKTNTLDQARKATADNPSSTSIAKEMDIEAELERGIGRGRVKQYLQGSKMTLDRPLYVLRHEGLFSGQHMTDGKPDSIYSALVIDPLSPDSWHGRYGMNDGIVYKLPAGTEIYHPASRADPNEVVLSQKAMLGAEAAIGSRPYADAAKKGLAMFGAGGAAVTAATSDPNNANAQEGGPSVDQNNTQDFTDIISKGQTLYSQGTPAATIQSALAAKYSPAQTSHVMLSILQPKIDELRKQGVPTSTIMQALKDKGINLSLDQTQPDQQSSSLPSGPEASQQDVQQQTPEALQQQAQQSATAGDQHVSNPGASMPLNPDSLKAGTSNQEGAPSQEQIDHVMAASKNLQFTYADIGKLLAGKTGLTPGWQAAAQEHIAQTNGIVLQQLRHNGINAVGFKNGDVLIQNPMTGETKAYNESMLSDLYASKFESIGAAGGAAVGARVGSAGFAAGPLVGSATTLAGTVVGGAIGAATGRGFDMIKNAMDTNYQLTVADTLHKMADAGVADATLSALGITGMTLLKGSVRYGKAAGRGLNNAWDLFVNGNQRGAQKTLKNVFDINDAQAIDIVSRWEKITGNKVLSDTARETGQLTNADTPGVVRAVTESQPGGQTFVSKAAADSNTGGALLASRIDERAKELHSEAAQLTNHKIDAVLQDKLGNYISDVKDMFDGIKQSGIDLMKDTPYRFSFKDTALLPSLESSYKGIHNYQLRQDLVHYMERIRELGATEALAGKKATKTAKEAALDSTNPYRSFSDLLDLRRTINELRGEKKFSGHISSEQLKTTLASVDQEIAKAVTEHMSNPDLWLRQWKAANVEYSKMKTLQSNVLYKTLTSDRVSPDTAVRAITKSMAYTGPETFMEVMGKLPTQTRQNVEGAVLRHLVEQNTVGITGGKQAINFSTLSEDLGKLAFTQQKSRDFKRTVAEMAQVFKNDPHLLAATGNVSLQSTPTYLADNIESRIKYVLVNKVFSAMLARVPFSKTADRVALTKQLSKLLDSPLNDKAIKTITAALPDDPELKTELHQLATQFVEHGKPEHYGKVPIYRVSKPGEFSKATQTKLGHGMLYYTNKAEAEQVAKETGMSLREVMKLHKTIAKPQDVERLLGHAPTTEDLRSPEVLDMLKRQDYIGLASGNRVLLFK